jgi:hypothetical protein
MVWFLLPSVSVVEEALDVKGERERERARETDEITVVLIRFFTILERTIRYK